MLRFVVVTLWLCQVAIAKEAEPSVKETLPHVKVAAPSGTYIGRILTTSGGIQYNAFRGIPFAEPPIGELRFKKTVALGKLVKEYDADEEKPFCVQFNMMPSAFGDGVEDCLYLNVFSPAQAGNGELKKVFVFIHGGGNMMGMKDFYNPASLVSGNDIIMVTANYRLGLLGFLSSQTASSPGNFGLWDQVEALRWVKENIQAFGGDPTAITVGGESAGGFDTTALSISPQGRGLFARVFPMSGALGVEKPMVIRDPLPLTEILARREKCLAEEDPTPQSEEEWSVIMECMRKVPADRFSSPEELGAMPALGPVIDGDFFPKPLSELFADAAYLESIGFHDRDYLVSVCYNEGDLFTVMDDAMKAAMTPEQVEATPPNAMFHGMIGNLMSYTHGSLSPEVISHIAEWYEENYEISPLADFGADSIFHVPSIEYMNAVASGWPEEESRVHFLRFVNFPEFLTGPYKGTLHGIDLVYLFDIDVDLMNKVVDYKADGSKWNQSDEELKKKYTALVASFVKTGKPSVSPETETFPLEWPAYTPEGGHYLEFSASPRILQHLKTDRVELFQHLIPAWIEEFPYTAPEENTQKHAVDEL